MLHIRHRKSLFSICKRCIQFWIIWAFLVFCFLKFVIIKHKSTMKFCIYMLIFTFQLFFTCAKNCITFFQIKACHHIQNSAHNWLLKTILEINKTFQISQDTLKRSNFTNPVKISKKSFKSQSSGNLGLRINVKVHMILVTINKAWSCFYNITNRGKWFI